MDEKVLEDVGLTKSEVAVYLALLELGSSTTGSIIKKAGIASGKAYLILDRLVNKGLVTYVIRGGRKNFQAADPSRLLDYLREKENLLKEKEGELEKIIPGLKARFEKNKNQARAEVFEGIKGFKTFYEWVLKEAGKGETIDILGVPRQANERMGGYLLGWNRRRILGGVKMRIIYNHDSREFGRKREKMRMTEVRYMKKKLETPAWIVVFGDCVASIQVIGNPLCFLIKDIETAESYRKYFEMIWELSVK